MEIVRIRLRKPRRVLCFRADGLSIERDSPCIVETENGLEWGVCVLPPEPCSDEMGRRASLRVVRRATASDLDNYAHIAGEEARAQEICRRKIEKHGLPMKLVDTEFTYDRHKIIFHFVAENRVDFRELVRDLAHDLRQRIELRHIQVRDQAKLVGGLGTCGRQLCCATFLEDFKPISMRMAKCQNLSLNPTKISGQCGRLLCCLGYEADMYDKPKKKRPCEAQAGEPAAADMDTDTGEGPQQSGENPERRKRKKRKRKNTAEREGGGNAG